MIRPSRPQYHRRPEVGSHPRATAAAEVGGHLSEKPRFVRDLLLRGAESAVADLLNVDTNNSVRVLLSHATGSGVTANIYSHGSVHGASNHVEIVGSSKSFVHANRHILPVPTADFFTSSK